MSNLKISYVEIKSIKILFFFSILGQVYFGDSARGHFLSNTFFLKDAQARGFHRWYSVVVFMKDKHLLLNSWSFFEKHINQMVARLQKKADQVILTN